MKQVSIALLCLLASAGGLTAQTNSAVFPTNRIRWRTEGVGDGHYSQEYYLDNRIVVRQLKVEPANNGGGMQISGDLFTDFEVDIAPANSKVKKGQIKGLKIKVALSECANPVLPVLDTPTPIASAPPVSAKEIAGQICEVEVLATKSKYGHASFTLPVLNKPLPPGSYRLQASVVFADQTDDVKAAIKWCSN